MLRWGERKLSQLQTDFDRRSKIPCYTSSIGFDFEMPKRCVLCSKSIGLFTRQAHEVEKEGLCLCTKCYSNLWLTQPNPKSQVKTLASIALSGKLSPEIKKIVVRRIKELVSVEKEPQEKIEQISDLKSAEPNSAINQELVDKKPIKLSEKKESVYKNVPSTPIKKKSCTKKIPEVVSPNKSKESLAKESDVDTVNNPCVTIVSDSSYPDLHFWADTPISICGVTIKRPFLYTIGESKLEEELKKNLTYCKFEDFPYLDLCRMFLKEEYIQRNKDQFTSYLDSAKILNHVFVLPRDDKLIIPAGNASQEEIDKLCMNSVNRILLSFSKEQSGCFIKWLSNYYPQYIHARFFTSEYMLGVWYRSFIEKKDLKALLQFWGDFVLSGEGYTYDVHDSDDINDLRRFLALLLIYTQRGNRLTQEEKQLVGSSINKVLSIKKYYVYKKGWRWDPTAILHECGCDDFIPSWLVLRQYLAKMEEAEKYNGSGALLLYFKEKNIQITPIFSRSVAPVGYVHDFRDDWECDIPYYTEWTIEDKKSIDEVIENISNVNIDRWRFRFPSNLRLSDDSLEWFYLPRNMRQELECPLNDDEISELIKPGQTIKQVVYKFDSDYSRFHKVPKNATSLVKGINNFYECLGYKTNIVTEMSLYTLFEATPIS